MIGITACGGHIPRLRLSRKAIADANAWFNPALKGLARGERAMCNWDEDSLTMAVEACRDALRGTDRSKVSALFFASTTMPFADRQNAGIMTTALNLSESIASMDVTSSQRAGTSTLLAGLNAVKGGAAGPVLVAAADARRTRASSAGELQFGDGAAAFLLGKDNVIAAFKGSHSLTVDFVDHYRGQGQAFDYNWEERWVRDEGFQKIAPKAIKEFMSLSGLKPADIDHFVMSGVSDAIPKGVAKAVGIEEPKVRPTLQANVGETGTAHPLVMLVHALQEAKAGQKILVVGFGQGCDVLLFETTDQIGRIKAHRGIVAALKEGKPETNYLRFLTFNGLVDVEKGIRAEAVFPTALTTLYRERRMVEGLIGGKCSKCGTPQFPKMDYCVNPTCVAYQTQADYPFADVGARVVSNTEDWLVFTINPPGQYGMVEFDGGGRVMVDFTDVAIGDVDVGTRVQMVFRVRTIDNQRGIKRYFWKAKPALPSA